MSYQFTYHWPTYPRRQVVYLLDRNVISLIRNVNAGKLSADGNKNIMLDWLRSNDKKEYLFSAMTSISEGDQKGIMTEEQFRTVILSEATVIGEFFQFARTDSDILNGMVDALSALPNGLNETPYATYVEFLKTVSPKIVNKVAVDRRTSIRDLIIGEAVSRGIGPSHPVVLCCLSILYGSDVSRRVLKPSEALKKDEWHNALSDIQIVSRLGQLNATAPDIDFVFVTMDQNLRKFVDLFIIMTAKFSPSNPPSQVDTIETYTNVNYDIFPELSERRATELGNILIEATNRLIDYEGDE